MSETIKVTDKRMFTADGELRDGQADRKSEVPPSSDRDRSGPAELSRDLESEAVESGMASGTAGDSQERSGTSRVDRPGRAQADQFPEPTFVDLVGLLAQPIAMFLGDAALPDSEPEENLPLARFHINLLELVQAKTQGNTSPEEAKLLEDLLYQLRMRYVEKVG